MISGPPLALVRFPDGLYVANLAEAALERVVVSSAGWFFDEFFGHDTIVFTDRPYVELRGLPPRSRAWLERNDPAEEARVGYRLEDARWADGTAAEPVELRPVVPSDGVARGLTALEPDAADRVPPRSAVLDFPAVDGGRTVIRTDKGGLRRVDPPYDSPLPGQDAPPV